MSKAVARKPGTNFRKEIPEAHRASLDTRLRWLWNQRFGTIQSIWKDSPDVQDKMATTIMLQAVWAADLEAISLLFRRLEGGAVDDETVLQQESLRI